MDEETTDTSDEEDKIRDMDEETKDGSLTIAVSDKNTTGIMTAGPKRKVRTKRRITNNVLHGQPINHLSVRKHQSGMLESVLLFTGEVQWSDLYS